MAEVGFLLVSGAAMFVQPNAWGVGVLTAPWEGMRSPRQQGQLGSQE